MDRLRSLQYFVRAVELGSLSAVGRELGTTQPTVSKVLGALEKELGVRLLERSTAGLSATPEGQRFYERSRLVLEEYEAAVLDARGLTGRPAGLLKINAPVGFGQFRLNALLQEFLAMYPDISVELILNDRYVDLVEEGVDVALRLGGTLPPNVVASRIGISPRHLVAAPAYLAACGSLRHPRDLARCEMIRFAWSAADEIQLHGPGGAVATIAAQGRYRVNNALAIRESIALGAGIGLCPAWLVQDLIGSGEAVRVLPRWRASDQELFVLYPSRRYQPLRARVFIAFLRERLAAMPGFSAPA